MGRVGHNVLCTLTGKVDPEELAKPLYCGNPVCNGIITSEHVLFNYSRSEVYHMGSCPARALEQYTKENGYPEVGEFIRVNRIQAYELLQPGKIPVKSEQKSAEMLDLEDENLERMVV